MAFNSVLAWSLACTASMISWLVAYWPVSVSDAPADSDTLSDADSLPVAVSDADAASEIVLSRLACADSVSVAVVASDMVITIAPPPALGSSPNASLPSDATPSDIRLLQSI